MVALDRSFHIDCYRCVDCNLLLSSEEQGRGYQLSLFTICQSATKVEKNLHQVVKNILQVLPPGQRRSVQAVQHTEDPSSHTATCPRQTEIVYLTLLGSNLCRTLPNSLASPI